MANNPFLTPTRNPPWPLPPLGLNSTTPNILFNTAAIVARLQSRWNNNSSNPSIYRNLFTAWSSTSQSTANTGFAHALKYLATGNSTEALNAYNSATSETFAFETQPYQLYSQSAPFAYAWCKTALTSAQNTTLINLIESNNAQLETNIAAQGKYLLDGPGNGNVGMPGYIYGNIAINGLAGTTDRRTNLRNLVQNMCDFMQETFDGGHWSSYDYLAMPNVYCTIAYLIATGEINLYTTRMPWLHQRGEWLARILSPNGWQYYRQPTHDGFSQNNGTNVTSNSPTDSAWGNAMVSWACAQGIGTDPAASQGAQLAKYVQNSLNANMIANNQPSPWTNLTPVSQESTFLGFFFSDDSQVASSPAQLGLPLNKLLGNYGYTEFRGGWNNATDLVGGCFGGGTQVNDHQVFMTGAFWCRVGNTWLIRDGHAYGGRGNNVWETAVPLNPVQVGCYTMCKSGVSYVPTSATTNPDRAGGSTFTMPSTSATVYPLSHNLTNGNRQTWDTGSSSNFSDNGTVAQVQINLGNGYPQVTNGKVIVGFKKGATSDVGTFVIWDTATAPGTIGDIRRNFWSFNKPTWTGGTETVLQGTSSAGLTQLDGVSSCVITSGSYKATVQMCSTMSHINMIGGTGYESFFDSYSSSGGGNLDWLQNSANPSDQRYLSELPWMQNIWRTSFLTTQSTWGGEMVYVITVAKTTDPAAPSYTRDQAIALLSQTSTAMPGMSQYLSATLLNVAFNKGTFPTTTFYVGAFTTVPSDNGTGGVEVTGNGYARVATTATAWNAATQGSPSSLTNSTAITFPTASGGNWGSITGFGIFDAASSGNLLWADYLGNFNWVPFTCTSASPGVITSPAHGYSNADTVVVSQKYGGTLPTTAGSWAGLLTVENVTTNTFDVSVNTTSAGDGQVRKVSAQTVNSGQTLSIASGQLTLTLA